MNRREFNKNAGLLVTFASLGGSIVFSTGCGAATIAQAIINSFSKILSFLQSAGIALDQTLVAAAQAALKAFEDAYNAFQKGTGTEVKLIEAAKAALDAVQAFFAATNIGGPVALVVIALAQVILSTLESFIPSPTPQPAFKLGGKSVEIPPVKRTLKMYLAEWNAVCVAQNHKELEIH